MAIATPAFTVALGLMTRLNYIQNVFLYNKFLLDSHIVPVSNCGSYSANSPSRVKH